MYDYLFAANPEYKKLFTGDRDELVFKLDLMFSGISMSTTSKTPAEIWGTNRGLSLEKLWIFRTAKEKCLEINSKIRDIPTKCPFNWKIEREILNFIKWKGFEGIEIARPEVKKTKCVLFEHILISQRVYCDDEWRWFRRIHLVTKTSPRETAYAVFTKKSKKKQFG